MQENSLLFSCSSGVFSPYLVKGKVNVLKQILRPLCYQNTEFNSSCIIYEVTRYRIKSSGSRDLFTSCINEIFGKINFNSIANTMVNNLSNELSYVCLREVSAQKRQNLQLGHLSHETLEQVVFQSACYLFSFALLKKYIQDWNG